MVKDRITHFDRWLEKSNPGEQYEYHRGFLPLDKAHAFFLHDKWNYTPRTDTDVVAGMAWLAYLNGHVELTQWKAGEGCYHYTATKRQVVRPVQWRGGRFD